VTRAAAFARQRHVYVVSTVELQGKAHMKKRGPKKETPLERRERLLREKLESIVERLSRLEKTVANLRTRAPKDKSKDAS
jgi:hypothetical protein